MQYPEFIKDYENNDTLRKSFFRLAADTFGLSFGRWYQEGFWNDRYIPFSYVVDER